MLSHQRYFDDAVQSLAFTRHGRRESVGVILAGVYHFGTEAAERMTIISGEASVRRDGHDYDTVYAAGSAFEVAAQSGFTITCAETCAYRCEYLTNG